MKGIYVIKYNKRKIIDSDEDCDNINDLNVEKISKI